MDVGVNQQRVRLTVDGLHLVLDRVEEFRLGPLDFTRESHGQILHHNPVRSREESNNVLDEMALVVRELLPVRHVLGKINLLREPHHCTVVLVLLPEVVVLDGEEHKPFLVLHQHWLRR